MTTILVALALGFAAGIVAGLFGVGGGILFVPTLLALGLSQIEAEATSLLAILPTVAAGTWRQAAYGNVRWRPAATVGAASLPGVAVGIWIADSLSDDVLRRLFALLVLGVAAQIAWRAARSTPPSGMAEPSPADVSNQ
jgi:uncharacterized membrane protein YfcA